MSSFVKKKKKKNVVFHRKSPTLLVQFWSEMKFYLSQCNIHEQYIMTDGTLSVLKPI